MLWRSVRDAAPFCGQRPVRRMAVVARLDRARARRASSRRKLPRRRAVFLRLGRRPDLDRAAAVRRRRRGRDPRAPPPRPAATPRSSARRRRCAPRSMCSSRSWARSPPSPGASRKASIPRACSIRAACGRASDADQFLRSRSSPIRDVAVADKILRACVHCGFCQATCPTYVLLGDELDSPRGRIYLIKEMLEQDAPATEEVVTHIDRCLSCLACMTTCPSGVHYMHLVDHARAHIEQTYRRPLRDRLMRALLAHVMPYPRRLALRAGGRLLGQAVGAAARRDRIEAARRCHPPRAASRAGPRHQPAHLSGRRRAPRPGRAARRLRQRGAGPVDHAGRDPPAQPPRRRGGGSRRSRLLRLARAPHGPRGGRACQGPRQRRRLDRARSTARGSTPSSSPSPAAAPR